MSVIIDVLIYIGAFFLLSILGTMIYIWFALAPKLVFFLINASALGYFLATAESYTLALYKIPALIGLLVSCSYFLITIPSRKKNREFMQFHHRKITFEEFAARDFETKPNKNTTFKHGYDVYDEKGDFLCSTNSFADIEKNSKKHLTDDEPLFSNAKKNSSYVNKILGIDKAKTKKLIIEMAKKVITYLKFVLGVTFWCFIPFFILVCFTSTPVKSAVFLNIILYFLILLTPIINVIYMVLLAIILLLITTEKEVKEHPELFMLVEPFLGDDANK